MPYIHIIIIIYLTPQNLFKTLDLLILHFITKTLLLFINLILLKVVYIYIYILNFQHIFTLSLRGKKRTIKKKSTRERNVQF
jgi:hypothetical protein